MSGSPATGVAPLPRPWRALFAAEVPLVAGTVLFWLAEPEAYLHDALGVEVPGPPEVLLLRLYAGSVGSLVLAFYAWLLTRSSVHRPTFRAFQACLGAGDVAIVVASLAHRGKTSSRRLLTAQIGMATFWGLLRAVFLTRT